jgi:predicted kinase
MKRAVIMRGLPGSGKSTLVAKISDTQELGGCTIFNADTYHMLDGQYRYDPKKAGDAHRWCFKAFTVSAMDNRGRSSVLVVDNTNTSSLQMIPYIRVAEAFGYDVWIIEMRCSILDSIERNIHGVPEDVICKMAMGMSRGLPDDWRAKYQCRYMEGSWVKDDEYMECVFARDGWYR